mmetsp:Transcript_33579/g.30511  ORF Transcript_33579/g.30511 Transcript_33579/m.30511 type:complete len:104 (+) Transcript_33579:37-348(+)
MKISVLIAAFLLFAIVTNTLTTSRPKYELKAKAASTLEYYDQDVLLEKAGTGQSMTSSSSSSSGGYTRNRNSTNTYSSSSRGGYTGNNNSTNTYSSGPSSGSN